MSSPVEEIFINTETPAMDHINKIMSGMNAALVRFLREIIIIALDAQIVNKNVYAHGTKTIFMPERQFP